MGKCMLFTLRDGFQFEVGTVHCLTWQVPKMAWLAKLQLCVCFLFPCLGVCGGACVYKNTLLYDTETSYLRKALGDMIWRTMMHARAICNCMLVSVFCPLPWNKC